MIKKGRGFKCNIIFTPSEVAIIQMKRRCVFITVVSVWYLEDAMPVKGTDYGLSQADFDANCS